MVIEPVGGIACVLAGLMAYAVRGRSSALLAPSVWRGAPDRRSIALTFDDGPSETTPELLAILDRHRTLATFFQCGIHVRRLPAVSKEVAAAGHELGNHSDTHAPFWFRGIETIHSELARAQESISQASGATPVLLRAPYGARWFGLREAQQRLGLTGVMWTAIGRDWKLPAAGITRRLYSARTNGAIFCLHDGRGTESRPDIRATLEAVGNLIPRLQDSGYHFETVSQILCPKN